MVSMQQPSSNNRADDDIQQSSANKRLSELSFHIFVIWKTKNEWSFLWKTQTGCSFHSFQNRLIIFSGFEWDMNDILIYDFKDNVWVNFPFK